MAAGLATLAELRGEGTYEKLETIGAALETMLGEAAAQVGVPCTIQRVGAMITVFFREGGVVRWEDAAGCDREAFARWHGGLLENGVYWPPSQFEAAFPSLAHDSEALERTRRALVPAFERALG